MPILISLAFSLVLGFDDLSFFVDKEGTVPDHFKGVYSELINSFPENQAAFDVAKVDVPTMFFALDILKENATEDDKVKIGDFEKKLFLNAFAPLKDKDLFSEDDSLPLGLKTENEGQVEEMVNALIESILKVKYKKYEAVTPEIKSIYEADCHPTFVRFRKKFGELLGVDFGLGDAFYIQKMKTNVFGYQPIPDDQAPSHQLTSDELSFIKDKISQNTDLPNKTIARINAMDESTEILFKASSLKKDDHIMNSFLALNKDTFGRGDIFNASALLVALLAIDTTTLADAEKTHWSSIARKVCDVVFISEGKAIREKNDTIAQIRFISNDNSQGTLLLLFFAISDRFNPTSQKTKQEINEEFEAYVMYLFNSIGRFFAIDLGEYKFPEEIMKTFEIFKPVSQLALEEAVPSNLSQEEISFLTDNLSDDNDPLGTLRGFMEDIDPSTPLSFVPTLVETETTVNIDNFLPFFRSFVPKGDSNLHLVLAALATVKGSEEKAELSEVDKGHITSIGRKILKIFFKDYAVFGVTEVGLFVRALVDDVNYWNLGWSSLSMLSGAMSAKYKTPATEQGGLDPKIKSDFNSFSVQIASTFSSFFVDNVQLMYLAGIFANSTNLVNAFSSLSPLEGVDSILNFMIYKVLFPDAVDSKILDENIFSQIDLSVLDRIGISTDDKDNTFPSFTSVDEIIKKLKALDKTTMSIAEYNKEVMSFFYLLYSYYLEYVEKSKNDPEAPTEPTAPKEPEEANKSLVKWDIDFDDEAKSKELLYLAVSIYIGQGAFIDAGLAPDRTTPSGLGLKDNSPENVQKFKARYKDFITSVFEKRYNVVNPDEAQKQAMQADFPVALAVYESDILSWFNLDDSYRLSETEVEDIKNKFVLPSTSPQEPTQTFAERLAGQRQDTTIEFEDVAATASLEKAITDAEDLKANQGEKLEEFYKYLANGIDNAAKLGVQASKASDRVKDVLNYFKGLEVDVKVDGETVKTKKYGDMGFAWFTSGIPMVGEYKNLDTATKRCVDILRERDMSGDKKLIEILKYPHQYKSLYATVRTNKDNITGQEFSKVFCGGIFGNRKVE